MEGWVKVHRKTLECPTVTIDAEYFAVWMYILLNATHKELPVIFGKEKIVLQPGQFITGHTKIADDLKISRSKVQRIIKRYTLDMQIDTQSNSKGTLISVLNWEKYQSCDTDDDTQTIRNRYASDTQVGTNKNVKNEKNVKEDKKFIKPTSEEVQDYCIEKGFTHVDAESFIDYYESKGWKVGNSTMKNWRSAVNGWERRSYPDGKKSTGYRDRTADVDITPHAYHGLDCN